MTWRLAGRADLPDVRAALADVPCIALDTEFHTERRYLPQLYLVQIKLPDGTTWILDPLDEHTLEVIADGLARPDWVVHGGQQDLRVLVPIAGRPRRVFDTQVGAGLVGPRYPASYADLGMTWLGIEIDKGETLSDWSRRPLHPEQLTYAAADVADLQRLWSLLAARADSLGRTQGLEAACNEMVEVALAPTSPDWRRGSAQSSLEPRNAAALQALFAWRERTAALLDQPARQIVPDAILGELARRLPKTRSVLVANRRLSKSLVRDFGDEILVAIHTAAGLPIEELPVTIRAGSLEARRSATLLAVAEILGAQASWAPGLVLPRARLDELAIAPPGDRSAVRAALGAWRDELVGDALTAFLVDSTRLSWNDGAPSLV